MRSGDDVPAVWRLGRLWRLGATTTAVQRLWRLGATTATMQRLWRLAATATALPPVIPAAGSVKELSRKTSWASMESKEVQLPCFPFV
ncbi:MAG: hypothetical protein A2V70_15930 [Planctomycetes bacterium RBG_13_63_9]|nr:MAG: hypothetical protein A2V70_15930 [Planctomycetes bacterium RBG_13_63_9]